MRGSSSRVRGLARVKDPPRQQDQRWFDRGFDLSNKDTQTVLGSQKVSFACFLFGRKEWKALLTHTSTST